MTTHNTYLFYVAVALSFVAELLHLWELPGNFLLWWAYGIFVLIAAIGQGVGASIFLFWPRFWMLIAGIIGNLSLLVMYLLVRVYGDYVTLNLPPLPFEVLNLIIAMVQLVLIILLTILFWQGLRARRVTQPPMASHKQKKKTSVSLKPAIESGESEDLHP